MDCMCCVCSHVLGCMLFEAACWVMQACGFASMRACEFGFGSSPPATGFLVDQAQGVIQQPLRRLDIQPSSIIESF